MDRTDIANLEDAGRAAMAWIPDGTDRRTHHWGLVAAIIPAAGIIAVAATLLLAVL
jgi:hypothetical protein